MRRLLVFVAVGTGLLLTGGLSAPLAAQCMACVSSSKCQESSNRGFCASTCIGHVCSCSDTSCKPGVTITPMGAEFSTRLASHPGPGAPESEVVAVVVRQCAGDVELLVYSADGMRLLESRLLARIPDEEFRETLVRLRTNSD